ncbi:hypothetical protein IVB22_01385 [Bradyrhizobium sp. 190]|uniref:hypothetical protein n=1 Tax=Bradyrhizobium sp. 190 TaxID=2782658 RepID=UPI001FFB15B2|nr:hypothetical protein [Bradyrhizobium sp. 190]MCK1511244.1 hypothetical protein [Bradyrhizobium sp. 190]
MNTCASAGIDLNQPVPRRSLPEGTDIGERDAGSISALLADATDKIQRRKATATTSPSVKALNTIATTIDQ